MPTSLGLETHLAVLAEAGERLVAAARIAGPTTPVPTCPGWTVADLVSHTGMVHRWASANLRGEADHAPPRWREEGLRAPDILEWFRVGLDDLGEALRRAGEDTEALVFLQDAPPPRRFWARRQAHETTIHAVDALAASLQRPPVAAETWIGSEVAVDGVDELLCGFLPRGGGKPRIPGVDTLRVDAVDTGHTWTMHFDADGARTVPGEGAETEFVLRGEAVELYLGLWNRGHQVQGPPALVAGWAEQARIRWR